MKMRVIIFALFLETLSLSFFEKAGLALEELHPVEIYNPPRVIVFLRTFSTKPTAEIRERLQSCITPENQPEENLENKQAVYRKQADSIIKEISSLWKMAILDLTQTAGSRSKRSFWSNTKQISRYLFKSPFLRSVLSIANGYVGNLINIFTDQDHYELLEHLEKKVINNTIFVKHSNNILLKRLNELEHQHCLQFNQLYLYEEVTNMIRAIEEEILGSALGSIPAHASYVNGLLSSCSKIGNSPRFCHKLLQNNLIDIYFDSFTFDEDSEILVSKTILKIPLEKLSQSKMKQIKIVNLGNWEREHFFKLDLSGNFIIQGDQILALDHEQCADTLCPFSAIKTNVPRCLGSLMQNSTEGCVKIFQEPPTYCVIENFGLDYIVTIPRGDVIFSELQPIKSRSVTNQTMLINQKVTLQCHGVAGTKTVTFKDQLLSFESEFTENSISALEFKNISQKFTKSLELESNISDLELSEDKIQVGAKDVEIFVVIAVSSALSALVSLAAPFLAQAGRGLIVALKSCPRKQKGELQNKGQSQAIEGVIRDRRKSVHFESRPESFVSINLEKFEGLD